jgi:hypothetical protein
MTSTITLETALCVSFLDIEALALGHTTHILPLVPIQKSWAFVLCPYVPSPCTFQERKYFPNLPLDSLETSPQPTLTLQLYGICEDCQILQTPEEIQALALAQQWHLPSLLERFEIHDTLLVATVRVYPLPNPIATSYQTQGNLIPPKKQGKFIGLRELNLDRPLKVLADRPILAPEIFEQKAMGYGWINTIAPLGHYTGATDDSAPKNTYQIGTDFENVVRTSWEFLGFTLDPNRKGGAGNLDFYCTAPYAIFGECKAGKSLPNSTVEQLIRLAGTHGSIDQDFHQAVKVILGGGQPTSHLLQAAHQWKVSIMKPETLAKLVQFQAQYPRAINPMGLRATFIPGPVDQEVDRYLEQLRSQLMQRQEIIDFVKTYLEKTQKESASLEELYAVYSFQYASMEKVMFHEILMELSSLLTGYLGRNPNPHGSPSFYFVQDLCPPQALNWDA